MSTLNQEDRLQKIFSNINEWLKFAEAKNFGLMTLNAAIIFGFTKINIENGNFIQKAGYWILIPFALISFLVTLVSLFPILAKIEKGGLLKGWINKFCNIIDEETKFENIFFYGFLKDIDEAEFEKKFNEKVKSDVPLTQYEIELITQILYNSRITWLKYQLFKIGAFIFLIGIMLFVLALPFFKFF